MIDRFWDAERRPRRAGVEGLIGSKRVCRTTLASAILLTISLAPASASQRCMVTDPTGTRLNVRRFDGRVIGALHNGEIVRVLRTGADRHGKPWAYVAYETNGEGWVYREFISCY
ncbi:MAG TPA: SH3 domain-containing protein [Roseiarcus sp.]|nr:SH3 domain-containing protein [Roseiarcus sp.]